jgi:hypothetical protein
MYDLVIDANHRSFRKATPAMINSTPMSPDLSPVSGKRIDNVVCEGDLPAPNTGGEVRAEIEVTEEPHCLT